MAVTYLEEKKQTQQQPQAAQQTYSGMKGVTQNTAGNIGKYQNGYQQSSRVTQAQQQLEQNQTLKPQGFISKWGDQLDSILQQIQNPKGFKYEFNGDNLFKSYADLYTQMGKQAANNAAGKAAALTGGYGNSYGANAAAQANQQYLLSLYEKGLDLRDRAYQGYQDQLNNQKDVYSLMAAREDQDYSRYRDTYNDWLAERNYLTDRLDTETNRDISQFNADRDYWTSLAAQENADYWQGEEFNENKRRYEQDFAENKRQYEQDFGEKQRQFNEEIGENRRQYDASLAEQKRQFDISDQRTAEQMQQQQAQFEAEIAEKQREFDKSLDFDKMTNQQKYAYDMVTEMLKKGKMPTKKLLKQAGMSEKDAKKFLEGTGTTGSGTTTPKTTTTTLLQGIGEKIKSVTK